MNFTDDFPVGLLAYVGPITLDPNSFCPRQPVILRGTPFYPEHKAKLIWSVEADQDNYAYIKLLCTPRAREITDEDRKHWQFLDEELGKLDVDKLFLTYGCVGEKVDEDYGWCPQDAEFKPNLEFRKKDPNFNEDLLKIHAAKYYES